MPDQQALHGGDSGVESNRESNRQVIGTVTDYDGCGRASGPSETVLASLAEGVRKPGVTPRADPIPATSSASFIIYPVPVSMTAVVLPIAPDQLPRLLDDPELFDEYLDTAPVDFEDRWTDVIHALRLLINNDQVTFQSVATSFGEDLGYGPAMLINAENVARLAHLVATVSQGDISSASERAIGNNDPQDLEWLTSVVSDTIHLIRNAHSNGQALIYAII